MTKHKRKFIKGQITISRIEGGLPEDEMVAIRLTDVNAVCGFVEVSMSLEHFAEAVTGVGRVPCKFEVWGLHRVGLVREDDVLEFALPDDGGLDYKNRRAIAIETAKKLCPDGWEASEYYGSQGSFFTVNNQPYARTTIFRWREPLPNELPGGEADD